MLLLLMSVVLGSAAAGPVVTGCDTDKLALYRDVAAS